jgi:hypothetical protein
MRARTAFLSRTQTSLRSAGDLVISAAKWMFPPRKPCEFCGKPLGEADLRCICTVCADSLMSWFVFESRGSTVSTAGARDKIRGVLKIADANKAIVNAIIGAAKQNALKELAKRMATCIPIGDYLRVDGVYLAAGGATVEEVSLQGSLAKWLAISFACRYCGAVPKTGADWQDEIVRNLQGSGLPKAYKAEYPVLLAEGSCALLAGQVEALFGIGAKEILLIDAWHSSPA